jgi:hypothetical protein
LFWGKGLQDGSEAWVDRQAIEVSVLDAGSLERDRTLEPN